MRFRSFAPALLSAALLALPSSAHAATRTPEKPTVSALAAARAGLYRLTLTQGAGGEQPVDLALEQVEDGFSALLLTPAHESWMSDVKFDGNRLTGTTLTSHGRGTIVLEMSDAGVRGTLMVAGQSIAITGTRER
jgi:hypothetical protein